MIKKIVYIHETFYRKHRDMGIEYLEKEGYDIELWSLINIKYKNTLSKPTDIINRNVVYHSNHLQILKRLSKLDMKTTMFFFTTTAHRGGIEDFCRIAVSLFGGRYCNFIYETVPVGTLKKNKDSKNKTKISDMTDKVNFQIYQFIIKKWCKPTCCFIPTNYSGRYLLNTNEKSKTVVVHNKDYDEYLENGVSKTDSKKYIVYLDSELADAEDFRKNRAEQIYPNPEIFFKNINSLFQRMEEHYNCEVIIAAHPKSEYKGNEFGNREIVYYKTNELVRDAFLVMTHATCAINYIILYRKNYIFLVDKYIKKHFVWGYLYRPLIRELGTMVCDFSKDTAAPWEFINSPNLNYEMYYKKYINETDNKEKIFYEIVNDYIKKI